MGYDLWGRKPTADEGRYFRRNIWGWPPLVNLCRELAPEEANFCKGWEENSGYGLSPKQSERLAQRLSELVADGTVAAYIKSDRKPPITDLQAKGMEFVQAWADATGAKVSFPGDASDVSLAESLSEEDVMEFVAFLKTCGGFEIL